MNFETTWPTRNAVTKADIDKAKAERVRLAENVEATERSLAVARRAHMDTAGSNPFEDVDSPARRAFDAAAKAHEAARYALYCYELSLEHGLRTCQIVPGDAEKPARMLEAA